MSISSSCLPGHEHASCAPHHGETPPIQERRSTRHLQTPHVLQQVGSNQQGRSAGRFHLWEDPNPRRDPGLQRGQGPQRGPGLREDPALGEAPASERPRPSERTRPLAGRKKQRHLVQVGTMGSTLCGVMAHSHSENLRMEGGRLMLLSHARQVVRADPPSWVWSCRPAPPPGRRHHHRQ